MDMNLVGLEWTQEEFHQAFNNRLEDMEDDMQICKNDMDVFKIQISSVEKDVKDVEISIDNAHLRLEKVEDQVNRFVDQLCWISQSAITGDKPPRTEPVHA
jgi:archaellum component FlaC